MLPHSTFKDQNKGKRRLSPWDKTAHAKVWYLTGSTIQQEHWLRRQKKRRGRRVKGEDKDADEDMKEIWVKKRA